MSADDYEGMEADELRDLVRSRDRRLREERESNETTTAWASAVADQNKVCEELIERWRDVFDMQMNEDGDWVFDPEQTELWDAHAELLEKHNDLARRWNRIVLEYNAMIDEQAPRRGRGQPLHASEAQAAKVVQLHGQGGSLRAIVTSTNLSLSTVRSILGRAKRQDQERRNLRRQAFNKEAAVRYRARKRARDSLEKQINTVGRENDRVQREAKSLGLARTE